MDNDQIAQILSDIADLLELKGANAFRIRAYRSAADLLGTHPDPVATLTPAALRDLPGIGKDLSDRIRELVDTGTSPFHQELLAEFPASLLELLRLQGVGARTVALLHRTLGIRTLDDLEAAAQAGRLRAVRGFGTRKEAQILKAVTERRQYRGRRLLSEAEDSAAALAAALGARATGTAILTAGSARRGVDTCGNVDLLAVGAAPEVMDAFTSLPWMDRVLARGETRSSICLQNGLQADLRLVPAASRGAALQYFTGSKAHNIALRDRALARGFTLNEYGLYRLDDDRPVAGDDESALYDALGLAWIPPELRENRGEIEAAAAGRLPRLITQSDLAGDVHCHTISSDGRADLEAMAAAARGAGLAYLAVTDHSKGLPVAGGLDEDGLLAQAQRIRALNERLEGISLLAGVECDIRPDGTLDLDAGCLAQLDLVIASVHTALGLDETQMTERLIRAIESPVVHVLGHPTGRLLLKRPACRIRVDRVFDAAARHGVALEINSQADRRDLGDVEARRARDRGVKLVVSSDAHGPDGFSLLRWGILTARRAWLEPRDVLNTRPLPEFLRALRRP